MWTELVHLRAALLSVPWQGGAQGNNTGTEETRIKTRDWSSSRLQEYLEKLASLKIMIRNPMFKKRKRLLWSLSLMWKAKIVIGCFPFLNFFFFLRAVRQLAGWGSAELQNSISEQASPSSFLCVSSWWGCWEFYFRKKKFTEQRKEERK